jgi:tyrosyl-tRNA synthetase
MGRTIQKRSGQEPQVVLTMPLLVGTDGVKKMSKSYGNYVGINESPNEMFGKLLSITDDLMWQYYELLSDLSLEEIAGLKKDVKEGKLHPKAVKVGLAKEIIARYHNKKAAIDAEAEFEKIFVKKNNPTDIEEHKTGLNSVVDVAVEAGLVESKSEMKRLITQGGVSISDERIKDINAKFEKPGEYVLKVGKRKFAKIIFTGGK